MQSNPYIPILTPDDVERFQEVSNGLHDGFITHVEFHNTGMRRIEGGYEFDYDGRTLVLHVLVTSLREKPVFELSFQTVYEYQIQDYQFEDMIGFNILFLKDGSLLWANDICTDIQVLKKGSYVIAEAVSYRRITPPSTNL